MGGDTLSLSPSIKGRDYEFQWRQTILPASLIGVSALAIMPTFLRNGSHSVTNTIIDMRGDSKRLSFDDYVQYVPVVGSLAIGLAGVKARHSLRDRTIIIATSYAAMGILVNVPKRLVSERRPNSSAQNSYPSGHTATAFMGAELMRIEYGGWYGTGAYVVATSIGFMRLYNGKHWLHDVVAGAGIGILSARFGEWSWKWWGKIFEKREKSYNVVVMPLVSTELGGSYGVSMNVFL
ncbi:MAG: phosphatase PAP2 family protein [Prevotellaceae bacterium]|nr:phosphatase PAP2 family protein [Prevotellaceae bacterium]